MRLCATVGRGMMPFVVKQLNELNAQVEKILEGKVLFDGHSIDQLHDLKCAERLFAVLAYEEFESGINKRELFDMLFALLTENATKSNLSNLLFEVNSAAFRISLKVTGKWRRKINLQALSKSIANHFAQITNIRQSISQANLEICIHVTEQSIFIGIPTSRRPLSHRPYLRCNALRSTVSDAMLALADIQIGHVVVDFTCGTSSLLLEAAHRFSNKCMLLGVDILHESLAESMENVKFLEDHDQTKHLIGLMRADIHTDFFKFGVIDRIISDLPFGQKYGSEDESVQLMQRMCTIISKYCLPGCLAVLLILAERLGQFEAQLEAALLAHQSYKLSLGTTQAAIVVINK